MIQKSKELKEKSIEVSDEESDLELETGDVDESEGLELTEVALATTALAGNESKNPWMLPSKKPKSQFSRLEEVKNAEMENVTSDENNIDDVKRINSDTGIIEHNDSNNLEIDELFDEVQRKRKALPKVQTQNGEDEGFEIKKSRKKKKLEKLKAKRKAKETANLGEFVGLHADSDGESKEKLSEQTDVNPVVNEDSDNDEGLITSLTRKRTLEDMDGNWSDTEKHQVQNKTKKTKNKNKKKGKNKSQDR